MNTRFNYYALLLFTAVFFSSCGTGNGEGKTDGAPQTAPVETDFIQLRSTSGESELSYPGSIEGSVNVEIKPQVTGYLQEVLVQEGDYVRKGQPLFKIRPEVFNAQVGSTRASLKAALANQASAKIEVDKIKPLVAGKVVTEMQLKTAESAYQAATAQVEEARAALLSSELNADFTIIKAPVSGYIGRIPSRVGNLVSPSDATPLTMLSEIDQVFVYFSMSEADFLSYSKTVNNKEGRTAASLKLADGTTYEHKGYIEFASGNIDRATGSMVMKAVFENPKKLLRSGGTAKVVINNTVDGVVKIPKVAVKDIQDLYFVYKLGDSTNVEMVPIEIAGGTHNVYFVKSGVKQGDKIAVNRLDMLQMGVPISPKVVSADSLLN
ncbi:membrane fusion protein, multidrug efflux system [Paenimyroides ummariense]|uniref:Membrane fusion protein, multidrug efflux system n=1 Tax=Paenimyroides ummariense TaxID=913024 RepID=A0A1I5EXR9_9FLAO|nr:efflux RND transporter periplasmic adaptor subunit [Paenimyroides ummariense]SFO16322.1 membrane fusion protein, multidrug efflux system [Paenimyroides ummariense]